jgi:hypothetical protein
MPNLFVEDILNQIENKFGEVIRIGDGYSLYQITSNKIIVYFRYSKKTKASGSTDKTFYGLRREDVARLYGNTSFICFVWDKPDSPILFPFSKYKNYFLEAQPAADGQFKTCIYFRPTDTELYFANINRFNANSFYGLNLLFDTQ